MGGIARLARRIVGAGTPAEAHEAALQDAEAKRARIEPAATALVQAKATWRSGQTPELWRAVRDAEDALDQARELADEADQTARKAASAVADEARAKEVAELEVVAGRLNEHPAFVDGKKRAVVALAQQLVRHYAEILEHSDEYHRMLRDLQDRARRLGVAMPALDESAPKAVNMIIHAIQVEVHKQHAADGVVDYTNSQRAAALVEGALR